MPVDAANRYDIMINGVGYMLDPAGDGRIQLADLAPATARSAQGEGRYDRYQTESYHAQAQFSGGVGQQRLDAADQVLTAIGDGRSGGQFFPARKKLDESDGGATSYYFERAGILYGMTTTAIEQVGTATSYSRPSGAVLHQPIESGNQNVFWVQDNTVAKTLWRWTGSGAATDITPGYTPLHITRYGRNLLLFAERDLPTAANALQSTSGSATSTTVSAQWTQPTKPGSTLIMVCVTEPSDAAAVPGSAAWGDEKFSVGASDATVPSIFIWTIPNADQRDGAESVTLTASLSALLFLIEVEGVAESGVITATNGSSSSSSTTISTGSVSRTVDDFMFSVLSHYGTNEDIGHNSASWTELQERAASSLDAAIAWSTSSSSDSDAVASARPVAGAIIAIPKTNRTVAVSQLVVLASDDDGQNWTPAPAPFSSYGFGDIRATTAADSSLWITTSRGLYQLRLDEQETVSGKRVLSIGINGPVDTWQLPPDDNVGKWLAVFEKALYYPVGATIRRYVPGGLGQQVFPSSRWATLAGPIQALVSGEGGIYFGMEGYLWCYDGRGYHCLATEPAAGALNYLYWHAGRLYVKADPADYFDFIYPSTRPDINDTTPATLQTGYVVTSSLDFEKVSEIKVIRAFQTQVRFSAATDTGTVTLDYYNGCTTGADPGRIGGGATSLSWMNVGTHAFADGYIKDYILDTPLKCYRLHLRATLTPGSSGYPILEGMVVNGRSIMPRTRRFVVPIKLATDTVDRQGKRLYDTPAAVNTAYDALKAVRELQSEFSIIYDDGSSTGETIKVTAFNLQDSRQFGNETASQGFTATLVCDELPS